MKALGPQRLGNAAIKSLAKVDAVDRIFVATKGGLRRPKGDWTVDGSPKWLRASCEASLRALNTDRIGLYQLHAVDRTVGLHASLGELAKLQAEGKILHIGLSNVGPDDLREALNIVPIVSVQNRCNVLEIRDFKTGLVDLCREHGMTFIPHSPVGGHSGHSRLREQAAVTAIAARHGCSVYGIALAWLLQQGEHILPIPGASKIASIEDSLRACSITLSSDELETLDRLGR